MLLKVLFIDFNSYFASVEQQLNPALRGKPIAVVPVMTDSTCAIAASYEAKAFGVKTGTNIGEAKQKCPGLICVPARHDAYVHFHHKLIDEVDKQVPVMRVESIDEMACELYREYREETKAIELAQRIKAGISKNVGEHLGSSIGLSTNRFLAKVASDLKKPHGITVLHPRDMPAKLHHLRMHDLPGIGKNMSQRLIAKGIFSIEQLYHAAPKQLSALWGSIEGERFWYALHGQELAREESERGMVTHSHVLGPEDRPLAKAQNVGRRLLLKAANRMRVLGYKATHLDLSVRVEYGDRLQGSVRFPAVNDSFGLIKVFASLWNQVLQQQNVRLKKVSLALHGLVPTDAPEQLSLFPGLSPIEARSAEERATSEKLSRVLDSVTKRYGRHALTLGLTEQDGKSFTGTKIAFNRIPEREDFEQWDETEKALRALESELLPSEE